VASAILLLTGAVSGADEVDTRTIAKAWGPDADVAECFINTAIYGIESETTVKTTQTRAIAGGNSISEIANLVDINKMSFGYRIKTVKVCELPNPDFPTSLIQSMQIFLGADGVTGLYELDAVGFEYGRCKTAQITGSLLEMTLYIIPSKGIHRIKIKDETTLHSFGSSSTLEYISTLTTKVFKFGPEDAQPIGIKGNWKFQGLTSLGIITINPRCIPSSGSYVEVEPIPVIAVEPQIVYIEKEAPEPITIIEEKEKNNTVLIVVIALVILVLFFAMNAFLCKRCIGKYKNRIQILEA